MEVKVVLAAEKNANLIKNIYPLYLHDLSGIYGNLPNEYGIFEDGPIKTLMDQYDIQNVWFEKPGKLFPFIIMVDGRPAGFDLVAASEFTPEGLDFYVYDFFLLRPYRGKNIAEMAAKDVFDKFKGQWGLYVAPEGKNPRGEKFWRKTIKAYSGGNYEEYKGKTFDGDKLIFKFNNSKMAF